MPTLKSRNEFPPNGWLFYQAETDWNAPKHIGFNETVNAIMQHRKANPRFNLPTDFEAVASELEDYTVKRLLAMPNTQGFLMDAPAGGYAPSFPLPRPTERAVAGGVKKAVAGAALLIDWLGEGMNPVSKAQSTQRALICAACQFNKPATGAQKLTGAAARTFHLLMEHKDGHAIRTPLDVKLNTCQICDCDLKLKVHAEISHIKKHTTTQTYERLDGKCWVRNEWNG